MKKSDLAAQVARRAPLTKAQAKSAVNAVFEVILDALANGETVSVTGFGRFSTKSPPARTGRNPQTGESVAIAASKTPSLKAGKTLRDRLR
ncbi:MAG: HU family DNA-binding protein [Deltaproteobacteria bacterium]|nr:HU family DNA-binding protein [Deltaproteobacteria bacterium]